MKVLILSPKDSHGEIGQTSSVYKFRGSRGNVLWPTDYNAHLGPVGAWNIFFRMGYLPEWINLAQVDNEDPDNKLLIISSLGRWSSGQEAIVKQWKKRGGRLLVAGISPHWVKWLGFGTSMATFQKIGHPNGAIGALLGGEKNIVLWSPGDQPYLSINGENHCCPVESYGRLFMIHGESQTPQRALKSDIRASALYKYENLFYLNANIFAGFQAWLQGQSDLAPWLNWRHCFFWLDEWIYDFRKLLIDQNILPDLPYGENNFGPISIVFRHDVDSSRDTSYLEIEKHSGIPATYPILKDRNTKFWVSKISETSNIECAFHYNTIKNESKLLKIIRFLGKRAPIYRPAINQIKGKGLWHQVLWAKKNKIGIETLHRHAAFLIYPEWIDSLDYIFEKEPEVLGSSSLFRSNLLRWGVDRVDSVRGTTVYFPNIQFPLWFPFKLSHAGYEGRPLRGWETTHIMEIEPEVFKQLIEHAYNLKFPNYVFILGFHPAHATKSTFTPNGCLYWFKKILEMASDYKCKIRTLRDIYQQLNSIVNNKINLTFTI